MSLLQPCLDDQGLLTMAFGAPRYLDMASALAMSLKRYAPDLPTCVITDRLGDQRLSGLFSKVILYRDEYGPGLSQKLHLDEYSPWQESLFIDCDCLVFRSLTALLNAFRHPAGFGVAGGGYLDPDSEHYALHDVPGYLNTFGVCRMPYFNSGVIWWNQAGRGVFEKARRVRVAGDSYLRKSQAGDANDEPIFGMAMELLGIEFACWRTEHMVPAVGGTSLRSLNVLAGRSRFFKTDEGRWVAPAIVHFNVGTQGCYVYRRERTRLRWAAGGVRAVPLADIAALATHCAKRGVATIRRALHRRS